MDVSVEFDRDETIASLEEFLDVASNYSSSMRKTQFKDWYDRVVEFLAEGFTDPEPETYFKSQANLRASGVYFSGMTEEDKISSFDLPKARKALRRILRELKGGHTDQKEPPEVDQIESNSIFIVHGHDRTALAEVARGIEKLNLNPIILQEQANQGATIIEKFERQEHVRFAVILMNDDDLGVAKKGSVEVSNLRARARQNVILELGYFIGKLGRDRVCVLKTNGVEEPSDIHGVVYTPFDETGRWKFDLVRELKAAGYSVSADDLL